jgi:hypothetical protein
MGKAVDRVAEEFSAFDVTVSVRPHAREFCRMVRCGSRRSPHRTSGNTAGS